MISQAEVHIEVGGDMPLKDLEMICLQVEMEIHSHFPDLERISIIPHSSISKPVKRWILAYLVIFNWYIMNVKKMVLRL
jgi:divalent metal cation (Fe/Co/Zn/Cd) transporter